MPFLSRYPLIFLLSAIKTYNSTSKVVVACVHGSGTGGSPLYLGQLGRIIPVAMFESSGLSVIFLFSLE